jgi:bifunctional enzyme CysN/CysC
MRDAELIERDIEGYLARHTQKEMLRLLTAGSVDDGKSTLIGRLLYDSSLVFDDQLDALRRDSAKKGSAAGEIDYSLLLDGLLSEREQGITIDVAYRYFATDARKFIIADTPGHEQYTRNMATGASTADLAIILVDARHGVLPQTRRHSTIAALLGIRHVVVAVNKMDIPGWDRAVFEAIRADYAAFAEKLGLRDVLYIPLSAREGDNVVTRSPRMPWYEGPTLLHHLETVPTAADRNLANLRFPVQYVIRTSQGGGDPHAPCLDFRGFAGTVASGVLRKGDRVMALPSRRTSRVERIVTHDGDLDEAAPPMAVTVTLADEIDLGRGEMLVHEDDVPHVARTLDALVVWMVDRPLRRGQSYVVKHGTRVVTAQVSAVHERLDVTTLESRPAPELGFNDIGRVSLALSRPLFFDPYAQNRATGAFILIDRLTNGTVGAGMIEGPSALADPDAALVHDRHDGPVSRAERSERLGQRAAAVVIAGGVELAHAVERRLWDEGYTAHVIEGGAPLDAVGALVLSDALGLITVASGLSEDEVARARAALVERLVELAGERSASVEAVIAALRARDVVR